MKFFFKEDHDRSNPFELNCGAVAPPDLVEVTWKDSFEWTGNTDISPPDGATHRSRGRVIMVDDKYLYISKEDQLVNNPSNSTRTCTGILLENIVCIDVFHRSTDTIVV